MSEDNKLLLLSIQQTLDENTEKLKKLGNSNSTNNESLKLDVEPINKVLNTHFNNMAELLENHLKKVDEFSSATSTTEPTHIVNNKTVSFIGVSPYSRFTIQKIVIVISILLFLFFTSWIGLHYWFSKGYKIRNQNIAFETLEIIKKNQKKRYKKEEILKIYEEQKSIKTKKVTTKNNKK